MIIGTAGHIDHGKSSLVQALTGVRMDRLREEQDRGITIDLNFAPFEFAPGQMAGVVDVPGHEDFVRTMVAGASGIDILLLVIAADEGIKPQTREHLAIAEQLGIRRGIPVLTKIDLVDAEWAALIQGEVADWLQGSSISFQSPRPVSALTGSGLEGLRADLAQALQDVPPKPVEDLFRLPVDRSFSVAGIGTVVTGTAWSGRLAPGDQVLIMPARRSARVRTVQTHGKDIAQAESGMRVALGLAGIPREEVRRGDTVVSREDAWEASLLLDVHLTLLPTAPRALLSRSRVRLHLATAEIMARVHPRGKIEPGSSGLARLTLASPGVARGGDRFVIRSESPVTTIGGGRILDPIPPRRKTSWPVGLAADAHEVRIEALITRRPDGIAEPQIPVVLGVSPPQGEAILAAHPSIVRAQDHWVKADRISDLQETAVKLVRHFHQTHPDLPGMPLANLRQQLRAAPWVITTVLEASDSKGVLRTRDGLVQLPDFLLRVEGGSEQVRQVIAFITRSGLTPPSVTELQESLNLKDVMPTLRLAARERRLEAVEADRYYAPEALARFVASLEELGKSGTISPASLRDQLGISRKYLIPLLEWADARGITVRTETARRLRPGYQLPWTIPAP